MTVPGALGFGTCGEQVGLPLARKHLPLDKVAAEVEKACYREAAQLAKYPKTEIVVRIELLQAYLAAGAETVGVRYAKK